MRRRLVGGGGGVGGGISLGAFDEGGHLTLQPVNHLPLRRHCGVQLINRRILMRNARFKGVEAIFGAGCVGGVGHGGIL